MHRAGWVALTLLIALAGQFVPSIRPPGPPPPQPWPSLVLRVVAIGPSPFGHVDVVPLDDLDGVQRCNVGSASTICVLTTFHWGSTVELQASADAAFLGAEHVQGRTAVVRLHGPRIVDVLLLPTTRHWVAGVHTPGG